MLIKKSLFVGILMATSAYCFAFPTTFNSMFSQKSVSSSYKNGDLRKPNFYDIHCSDGKEMTCWGAVFIGPTGVWKCNSGNTYYHIPRYDYHFLYKEGVPLAQFNNLKAAQKDVGDNECAHL